MSKIIEGRAKDLGGFSVRRVLPYREQKTVGPWIFFDHIGPANFAPGEGIDVRPHPHIGLATVTYLFEGSLFHRDSLGSALEILPGDMNWMTAGSGITHSERTSPQSRARPERMHGIQSWVALPKEHEEIAPSFAHYPQKDLPLAEGAGWQARIIAGDALLKKSPVKTLSPLFYVDVAMKSQNQLCWEETATDQAIYVADGSVKVGETSLQVGQMFVFDGDIMIDASEDTRLMVLGGEPFEEERHIWWNFVSSKEERIKEAKRDWNNGKFASVPGEEEFIPLPED